MEDQQGDADSSLLELNPLEEGGSAAQPSPQDAGNGEKVATKGGVFPCWKSSGKGFGVAKPLLAAVLFFVLLLEVCYSVSPRFGPNLKTHHLPLDDVSMQKYLNSLNTAAEAMEEAWESSGLPARQAFQKHFTPSLADGQLPPPDPLATIRAHVSRMRRCKVPPDSSVAARRDFARHLQLLRCICRTVTLRLEEFEWFLYITEDFDVPIPVPGHDEPLSYPDVEGLEGKVEDGLSAAHFLKAVGLFGGESKQKVNEMLTDKLTFMLAIENKHTVYNLVARYYFESFLQPFEGDDATPPAANYKIPYTGEQFQTRALTRTAARIFSEFDNTTKYANVRRLYRIAENWTPKAVLAATKQQEEANANNFKKRLNAKRKQMLVLLREGIPYNDLVSVALFLL